MDEFLLGVDIGTSACKVVLISPSGEIKAQASESYSVNYPKPGWAEQEPEAWWDALCRAIRRITEISNVKPTGIAGIGVAGQSWAAVAIDRNGCVLCPTPIWMDTRANDICTEIKNDIGEEAIFQLCGNPLQPTYTLPKILWYKRFYPEMYLNTYKILQSNGYIVYKLTDKITQDISQGYGLHFFNMKKGEWDAGMAKALGTELSHMPDLYPCHAVVGHVTKQAAAQTGLTEGIPVVAGGLDAACGTLGAGVLQNGQTQEQGGQAGGMSICLDRYAAHPKLILGFHVVPNRWLLQGGTVGGGGTLKWLREEMFPDLSFEDMSALAGTVPQGSDGLVFLPYMAGERSPVWNPRAKGVFYGLDYAKTRAHLIRAVMEGAAYSVRHNLETAEDALAEASVLYAMGGSANSYIWTQIKADVTGKEIQTVSGDTATTLGAAILAGVGIGIWDSFEKAVSDTVVVTRKHIPSRSEKDVYDSRYRVYRALYENLKDLMNCEV